MKKKVTHLADVKHDSTLWSPLDALRAAIEDIESHEINPTKLSVFFIEETPENRMRPHEYVAGFTYAEHVAFLLAHLLHTIDEWREH